MAKGTGKEARSMEGIEMRCEKCNVVGFSLEELLPDGLCIKCRVKGK